MDVLLERNIYPLQVSVNNTEAMHILHAFRDVDQLNSESVRLLLAPNTTLTSPGRFTCLSLWMNSLMSPFTIHSEAIANWYSFIITPSSGKIFGCRRCFQVTASRQNLCNSFVQTSTTMQVERGTLTLRMVFRSWTMDARKTFMATWRPLYFPRDTLANPPCSTTTEPFEQSGMYMDLGITRCRLHALQSSLNNFSRSRSDVV